MGWNLKPNQVACESQVLLADGQEVSHETTEDCFSSNYLIGSAAYIAG